jgi:RsmE family RNA methyltransferase
VEEPVVIAVGPERGWSARERTLLRDAGFRCVHLGERVLRVETACVASISLVRAQLGRM